METEHWIAIIGIIISAIIAYITTKATINREKRKGKLIILELIKQYLINYNSSWDIATKKVKTDNVSKEQYVRVLEIIEKEFLELVNNPYYLGIVYKYPKLTQLQTYISREIAELSVSNNFGLNNETLRLIFELFDILKKDIKKKYFKNGERFFELNTLITEWKGILKI